MCWTTLRILQRWKRRAARFCLVVLRAKTEAEPELRTADLVALKSEIGTYFYQLLEFAVTSTTRHRYAWKQEGVTAFTVAVIYEMITAKRHKSSYKQSARHNRARFCKNKSEACREKATYCKYHDCMPLVVRKLDSFSNLLHGLLQRTVEPARWPPQLKTLYSIIR